LVRSSRKGEALTEEEDASLGGLRTSYSLGCCNYIERKMAEANSADSNPPPVFRPPAGDSSQPPQFDPSQPNPPVFEPPKQFGSMPGPPVFDPMKPSNSPAPKFSMGSGLPSSPPVFEMPKFAMPSEAKGQSDPPGFDPPKFSASSDPKPMASPPAYMPAKAGLPAFQPPAAGQAGEPPMESGLSKQGFNFKPVFQPPPGIVFPAQQGEGPKFGAPQVEPAMKLPSQDPPKFSAPQDQGQAPVFKSPGGIVPVFNPMKPEGPKSPPQAVKPGLPSQSPWVASQAKPEEVKNLPKPGAGKFGFKTGPQPVDPPQKQTPMPLRDLGEMGKPRGIYEIIREKGCLRLEEPNEWDCPQCHYYNTIEFIQCEMCVFENKVLAGILTALEMPGKKREKNLMEKGVEKLGMAKSWLGF